MKKHNFLPKFYQGYENARRDKNKEEMHFCIERHFRDFNKEHFGLKNFNQKGECKEKFGGCIYNFPTFNGN